MPTATPLQVVKSRFGSKAALVDKALELVEPLAGESRDEHKSRLGKVANAKLLHLVTLGEKVKELGGRAAIVQQVLEFKGQSRDFEFADKLKALSLGKLVDLYQGLKRRRAAETKSA